MGRSLIDKSHVRIAANALARQDQYVRFDGDGFTLVTALGRRGA